MTVTIRVTDSDNNTYEEDVDIDINDINEKPEDLDLSNLTIDEQDGSASNPGVGGLVVGVLTSTDVDDGDTATYTLLSQSVAGAFEIVGNELRVLDPSVIDSEASVASIDVEVQVEDSGGLTQVKTFTINVDAINDEDPTNVDPDVLNISATLPKDFLLTNLFAGRSGHHAGHPYVRDQDGPDRWRVQDRRQRHPASSRRSGAPWFRRSDQPGRQSCSDCYR